MGIREVIPLIEVRKSFSLDLWELDNSSRSAEDIDLSALEKAAWQMAAFEDQCLYYGLKHTHSPGLLNATERKVMKVSLNTFDFLRVVTKQLTSFKKEADEGPYNIILPDKVWIELVSNSTAYPFQKLLKEIIKGNILTHHHNKDIFLVCEGGVTLNLTSDRTLPWAMKGTIQKR